MNINIFCKVIDNFGDIGVCWRLAKIFAVNPTNQQMPNSLPQVSLWVDDLEVMAKIVLEINSKLSRQVVANININHWQNDDVCAQLTVNQDEPILVIESFGVTLPEKITRQLAEVPDEQLFWINLEYLTAESWAEDCHLQRSPQTINRQVINKYFFFPGFSDKTGGVNFEPSIFNKREQWKEKISNEFLLQHFGVNRVEFQTIIFYFAYENHAIETLLNLWQFDTKKILLLIPYAPHSESCKQIKTILNINTIIINQPIHRGNLTLIFIDFLPQSTFDQLLWSCDINFVRGEDSFVRAQIAQKPFIWSIYPQTESTHLKKLSAFLDIYEDKISTYSSAPIKSLASFWQDWNQGRLTPMQWQNFLNEAPALTTAAQRWANHLKSLGSLAENIIKAFRQR